MQYPIGFHIQKYRDGACGKYALQHALLLLGIPISQKDATKATGIPPSIAKQIGTNQERLKRGIRYFSCIPLEYSYKNPGNAKKRIDSFLSEGYPIIISVENAEHWAVIAGKKTKSEYYWIDSADHQIIGLWKWNKIVNWINDKDIYFIGVKPRNGIHICHSIVPKFSQIIKLLKDKGLRKYWGYYLEDLLATFDCPEKKNGFLTADEFFQKNKRVLFNTVRDTYYYADIKHIKWELNNYKTVAASHYLTISKQMEKKAVVSLSSNLTLLACGIE